jgi:hypothetical protein
LDGLLVQLGEQPALEPDDDIGQPLPASVEADLTGHDVEAFAVLAQQPPVAWGDTAFAPACMSHGAVVTAAFLDTEVATLLAPTKATAATTNNPTTSTDGFTLDIRSSSGINVNCSFRMMQKYPSRNDVCQARRLEIAP